MCTPKILLVDDSNTVLMMERMLLQPGGYQLVEARNGIDALEVAARERPDLILMDVVMPEMNGFEATRRLREDPLLAHIPVIMVTTRGEEENVEAGFACGANDYVTKPINAIELAAKIQNLLPEPS